MKAVFADTSFFLASLNPDDELIALCLSESGEQQRRRVVNNFVLINLTEQPGSKIG